MSAEFPRIEVQASSRIHATLTNLSSFGRYINGGLGFAVEEPAWKITATHGEMHPDTPVRIASHVGNLRRKYSTSGMQVSVDRQIPSHLGHGATTPLMLAVTEAFFRLHGIEYDQEQLIKESGRGRTSGIGVKTYFEGGVILDGGHQKTQEELAGALTFSPSSIAPDRGLPVTLDRVDMPNWPILLIRPEGEGLSGKAEDAFFRQWCPIPEAEFKKTSKLIQEHIWPSLQQANYSQFCEGINLLQETFWKAKEISTHGTLIPEIMSFLKSNCADGLGMSSFGPLLYCFTRRPEDVLGAISEEGTQMKIISVLRTQGRNQGRAIRG